MSLMNKTWIEIVLALAIGVLMAGGWTACGKKEEPQKTPEPAFDLTVTSGDSASDSTTISPSWRDSSAFVPPVESPRPAPVRTAEGNYTVQVSSWRTRAKAEREALRFREEGYDAYVQARDLPHKGGIWYRVRVGRFGTRIEAEQVANDLLNLLESGYWVDRVRRDR